MKLPPVAAVFLALAVSGSCSSPPEADLERAQEQVERARRAEAALYAAELMRSAEDLLRDASAKVAERSYGEARALAEQAAARALEAERAAQAGLASRRQHSAALLTDVGGRLAGLQARLKTLPPGGGGRSRAAEELGELETLLQSYRESTAAERFSEAQTIEETLMERLRLLTERLASTGMSAPAPPSRSEP